MLLLISKKEIIPIIKCLIRNTGSLEINYDPDPSPHGGYFPLQRVIEEALWHICPIN